MVGPGPPGAAFPGGPAFNNPLPGPGGLPGGLNLAPNAPTGPAGSGPGLNAVGPAAAPSSGKRIVRTGQPAVSYNPGGTLPGQMGADLSPSPSLSALGPNAGAGAGHGLN